MDDILKRMLAVEKEAEDIVEAAEGQARDIMAAARKQANDNDAAEQTVSAREYDELLERELKAANDQRTTRLSRAQAELEQRAKEFSARIAVRKGELVEALLG